MHFHYMLFAEILHDLAKTVTSLPLEDVSHREALRDAAKALYDALKPDAHKSKDKDHVSNMTSDQQVRLLHIME